VAVLERAARVLERVALVPVDDQVLEIAARLEPFALRSLDAVHLATALSLPPLDAFVAYDARVIDGARELGCEIASPR
jgi:predicted nucleic acid-binding protein